MDRHPSTIKRHRQSLRRREANRAARSRIRTSIKQVEQADSPESASTALQETLKVLDKAAGDRYFHRNKVARIKSRLSRLVATRFAS